MKSRDGKSQRREVTRREEKRRRSIRESQEKDRNGRKVAKHRVFPMICGSEGRKIGSLKRRVRSQLESHMSRPLVEVELSEKCTVVARSIISKATCLKHRMLGPVWDAQRSFRVTGTRDSARWLTWVKFASFVAVSSITTTTYTLHNTATTTRITTTLH